MERDKLIQYFLEKRKAVGVFIARKFFITSTEELEDILSDYQLKLLELSDEVIENVEDNDQRVFSWFITSLVNHKIDLIRSKKIHAKTTKPSRNEIDFARVNVLDEEYIDMEDRSMKYVEVIAGEIGYLYLTDRIVHKLKYEEIAEKYKVPLGTVKGTLSRAMTLIKMRKKLVV